MPSTSHARCKRCGGIRHKNVRSQLCGTCWSQFEKPRLRAEKAARAERRAAKRTTTVAPLEAAVDYVLEEKGTPMRRRTYTDEQRLEIGRLYEEGLTYSAIKERTGAETWTVVGVARALNLPLRQPRYAEDKKRKNGAPPPALPAEPEPVAPTIGWHVRYQIVTVVEREELVEAANFTSAANHVYMFHPDAEILELRKA